jgi:homoserine O-succinyltransferase
MKGEKKFKITLEYLMDDDKVCRTNEILIPDFFRTTINDLMQTKKMMSN